MLNQTITLRPRFISDGALNDFSHTPYSSLRMTFVMFRLLVNSVICMFPSSMTSFVILYVTLFHVAMHVTCLQCVRISGLTVYESSDAISYYVSWNGTSK